LDDIRNLKKALAQRSIDFFNDISAFTSGFKHGEITPSKPSAPRKKGKITNNNGDIIIRLPKVDPMEFDWLYTEFNKKKFKVQKNRGRGFLPHECAIYGISVPKYPDKEFGRLPKLSAPSKENPKIMCELYRIGKLISPPDFTFNTITVNHNTTAPRHQDDKNAGKSILVSFGDYTGSNIIVEAGDEKYEMPTKYRPVFFDGSKLFHYNSPDLQGNKYSLVFYTK
jgi:hypothetical protein